MFYDEETHKEIQFSREREQLSRERTLRLTIAQLGAYILIVMIGVIGFFQIDRALREIERQADARVSMLCENTNDGRRSIVTFIDDIIAFQDRDSAEEEFLRQLAAERFPQLECPPNPYEER